MNRILYIGHNCHQCKEVVDYLISVNIPHEIVNIDEQDIIPPVPLFVFPALFENNVLVGYGIDIISKVKATL
ncbi:thioredoxin domain-containing protein [Acidiluteibacter ferrifornacis]|uniref:Glutaredoxin n=1 Tax=Acidiluteibacter ferrifornacis TaxID=2692424 RepID=A0A6N9NJB4_9FLAO|nr:hypothetical protein [Acidiluteibacter ferrifornacis]NBG65952.1 hypothetical protein [Acidiluteibacter ferrifornacis]